MNTELREKERIAIERLKAFEPEAGYFLAYSGGKNTTVTGNYTIVTVDDNGIYETELSQRGAELVDLLRAVCPSVVYIRYQLRNGNELHFGRCFHQTSPHSANFSKPPTKRM